MGFCCDVPAMQASLDLEREDDSARVMWLEQSRKAPDEFWGEIYRYAQRHAALQSRRNIHYDLYLDCIERHCGSGLPAMVWYEGGAFRSLSYDELASRAARCADAWARHKILTGQLIALALPIGPEFLVAFGALLHLGSCITVLDPGPVNACLRQFSTSRASLIVTDRLLAAEVATHTSDLLQVSADGRRRVTRSHVYQPDEACWSIQSPLQTEPRIAVNASEAFDSALADALLALRLETGARFAAPGWSLRQCQPSLLCATLLAGCTYVHLTLDEVRANPGLLVEAGLSCLALSSDLLSALGDDTDPLPGMRHLIKAVDEPLEWSDYRAFLARRQLTRVHCSNLLVDAATGGCLLFSARRRGSFSARVFPVAGRHFTLSNLATGQREDGATLGVYQLDSGSTPVAPCKKDRSTPEGFALLTQRGSEWFYGGTAGPRRASHRFPTSEVLARVQDLNDVLGACVVPIAQNTARGSWSFCLLVFTQARDCSTLEARVCSILDSEIGPEGIPDRIEVIPYCPRRFDRQLDVHWYQRRYQTKACAALWHHPISRTLSSLRARLSTSDSVQSPPLPRKVGKHADL